MCARAAASVQRLCWGSPCAGPFPAGRCPPAGRAGPQERAPGRSTQAVRQREVCLRCTARGLAGWGHSVARCAHLEEEDVCRLHAGVEDLRCRQVVILAAAHDLRGRAGGRRGGWSKRRGPGCSVNWLVVWCRGMVQGLGQGEEEGARQSLGAQWHAKFTWRAFQLATPS